MILSTRRRIRKKNCSLQVRRASVLVLTLVVVAMLTLGAAAFFERMFAEHQAERAHGQQLQASQLAESGVEYMKVLLSRDPAQILDSGGLYANPSLFQGVVVNDDPINHEFIIGDDEVHARHESGTEVFHPPVPGEVSVGPGRQGVTTYLFDEPGSVRYVCHLPGHAAYGMQGVITVE